MNNIHNKIWDIAILDSEIIQETESVKSNDPKFDINLECGDVDNWSLLMFAIRRDRRELVRYLLTYPNIDLIMVIQHCIFVNGFLFLDYFSAIGTLMLIYKMNGDRRDYTWYVIIGDVKYI